MHDAGQRNAAFDDQFVHELSLYVGPEKPALPVGWRMPRARAERWRDPFAEAEERIQDTIGFLGWSRSIFGLPRVASGCGNRKNIAERLDVNMALI